MHADMLYSFVFAFVFFVFCKVQKSIKIFYLIKSYNLFK